MSTKKCKWCGRSFRSGKGYQSGWTEYCSRRCASEHKGNKGDSESSLDLKPTCSEKIYATIGVIIILIILAAICGRI